MNLYRQTLSVPIEVFMHTIRQLIQYFPELLYFQADNMNENTITYDIIEVFSLTDSHYFNGLSTSKQIQYYCKILCYQAKNTTIYSIIQEIIVLATISIHNNWGGYRDNFPIFLSFILILYTLKPPKIIRL